MTALTVVRSQRSERERIAAFIAGERIAANRREVQDLVGFFRRNKYPLLAVRGSVESPAWAAAVEEDIEECESQRAEFLAVRDAWARENIDCIAIKSGAFYPPFPYTSDNVDLLVRRADWPAAIATLEAHNYVRLTNTDEANKLLFRKFRAGRSVSAIHLHGWVGWDVGFHDERIWERAQPADEDASVTVPSPEDVVLINAAHALFENKQFTLFDLERVRAHWARPDLDWAYIEDVARQRGFLDGLLFALAVLSGIERQFFGRTTAPQFMVAQWEQHINRSRLMRRYYGRLMARAPVALPFRVSFSFSKLLYYRKVLSDQHDSLPRRAQNAVRTLLWGIKQKSGLNPQRSMLIAFSGLDGSGKSSHARALSEALRVCDVTHQVVWSRPGCSALYRLFSRPAKRVAPPASPPLGRTSQSAGTGALGKFLRLCWTAANAADLALLYAWKIRLPLLFGTVVICDRYVIDAIIELRERLPASDRLARRLAGLLGYFAPRPRRTYLLDLPLGEAQERRLDGADEASEDIRRAYLEMANCATVEDAKRDFIDLSDENVIEVLETYFRDSSTWLNALLLSNPRQLNRLERHEPRHEEVRA